MGGRGSTRWGRHRPPRPTVEDYSILSLRRLLVAAPVREGFRTHGQWATSPFGPVEVETDAADGPVQVTVRSRLRKQSWHIPADLSFWLIGGPTPFGLRWWLACPACGQRCLGVYCCGRAADAAVQGLGWGCRRCLGLTYPSQRETQRRRRERRRFRVLARLGGTVVEPGRIEWSGTRPKRMRRRTFSALCQVLRNPGISRPCEFGKG